MADRKCGVKQSHWGFYQGSWRVGDYWPSSGLVLIGCQRRHADDLPAALEIVAVLVGPPKPRDPSKPNSLKPAPRKGKTQGRKFAAPEGKYDRKWPR